MVCRLKNEYNLLIIYTSTIHAIIVGKSVQNQYCIVGTGSDLCGSFRRPIWRGSCVCGILKLYHQPISSLHTHRGARDFAFVDRIIARVLCDPLRCNHSSANAYRHPSLPLAPPSIYYI